MKTLLAYGAAVALLVGIPAVSLIHKGFKHAEHSLQQADSQPAERIIDVWVGSQCVNGRMVITLHQEDLDKLGCQERWQQEVTKEQMEGFGG